MVCPPVMPKYVSQLRYIQGACYTHPRAFGEHPSELCNNPLDVLKRKIKLSLVNLDSLREHIVTSCSHVRKWHSTCSSHNATRLKVSDLTEAIRAFLKGKVCRALFDEIFDVQIDRVENRSIS